ncbi:hypothetical protein J7382_12340 [Shimia sp. R11_0]|uniref:hypothetical protein n=1 Tax=Shimia sp. R11_0 TaxID=2821096 RepID=UPI001ADC6A6D|nr:hypothetical protein [Shimia sp. R11_0]MBO9478326.1 hypothetical protein [Shimia sp. R11_0]
MSHHQSEVFKVHQPLTAQERVLTVALATWLREEMINSLLDPELGFDPDTLYDIGQSNYEWGCDALSAIGVLEFVELCIWRIKCPLGADIILPEKVGREHLDQLLDALVKQAPYVSELFRFYEPVAPKTETLLVLCEALCDCGYMERFCRGKYEWHDRFGPWMVWNGEWDLLEFEPAPKTEVEAVLASLPDWLVNELSDIKCTRPGAFLHTYFQHWVSNEWQENIFRYRMFPSDDMDLPLVAGLYEQIQEK